MLRLVLLLVLLGGLLLTDATAQSDAPPLPERNPARLGASVPQTPPPPGEVATNPWSDAEVATAKAKCTEMLSSIKLDYEPLAPIKQGLCGAPAPILLKAAARAPLPMSLAPYAISGTS